MSEVRRAGSFKRLVRALRIQSEQDAAMNAAKKNRGPGRPPSGDEPADQLCRFKCTATERKRIEALAEQRGMRLSEYLRGAALGLF